MNIFKILRHIFAVNVGIALAYVFAGLMFLLVINKVSQEFPVFAEFITDMRCAVGFPAEDAQCVRSEIEILREKEKATAKKLGELEARLKALDDREAELAALSGKVTNFSLFEQVDLDFGPVSTGVRFATVLKPEDWSAAWCYVDLSVRGFARKVDLGKQDAGAPIKWSRISDAQLRDANLSRAQFERAKEACQFPRTL